MSAVLLKYTQVVEVKQYQASRPTLQKLEIKLNK